jgi:hypothetical protein
MLPPRWEYMIASRRISEGSLWQVKHTHGEPFTTSSSQIDLLKTFGTTGWELCSTTQVPNLGLVALFFKRQLLGPGESRGILQEDFPQPPIDVEAIVRDLGLPAEILEDDELEGPPTDF